MDCFVAEELLAMTLCGETQDEPLEVGGKENGILHFIF